MQTTASSEKKYAPPKRSEKQIGNTTFIVNSFFWEKDGEGIPFSLSSRCFLIGSCLSAACSFMKR